MSYYGKINEFIEHLKQIKLHIDLRPIEERILWITP